MCPSVSSEWSLLTKEAGINTKLVREQPRAAQWLGTTACPKQTEVNCLKQFKQDACVCVFRKSVFVVASFCVTNL